MARDKRTLVGSPRIKQLNPCLTNGWINWKRCIPWWQGRGEQSCPAAAHETDHSDSLYGVFKNHHRASQALKERADQHVSLLQPAGHGEKYPWPHLFWSDAGKYQAAAVVREWWWSAVHILCSHPVLFSGPRRINSYSQPSNVIEKLYSLLNLVIVIFCVYLMMVIMMFFVRRLSVLILPVSYYTSQVLILLCSFWILATENRH